MDVLAVDPDHDPQYPVRQRLTEPVVSTKSSPSQTFISSADVSVAGITPLDGWINRI
jgi:hypothetical protein